MTSTHCKNPRILDSPGRLGSIHAPLDSDRENPGNSKRLWYLRDGRIRRTADAAARQLLLLVLGGGRYGARGDHRRLRRRQYGDVVVLLMHIRTGADRFDAALESTVVAAVRCIQDVQIVDTAVGSEVESGAERRNGVMVVSKCEDKLIKINATVQRG